MHRVAHQLEPAVFKLQNIYSDIIKAHQIQHGLPLLDFVIQYKILEKSEIVKIVNNLINPNQFNEDYDFYYYDLENNSIYTRSENIELPDAIALDDDLRNKELHCAAIFYKTSDLIYVFCDMSQNVSYETIHTYLCNYSHKIINLSPSNFNELTGHTYEYNPMLLLRRLIVECMHRGGANLKIEPRVIHHKPNIAVRFRIDKTVIEYTDFTITEELESSMLKTMLATTSSVDPTSIDKSGGVTGLSKHLLCNDLIEGRFGITKMMHGYLFNLRIQFITDEIRNIAHLGLDSYTENALRVISNKVNGLTIITGPMNSGKTTTLWAVMSEMLEKPISCVEYSTPVEAEFGLPQVDYGENLMRLHQMLSIAKKQDIDVAFLNEIPNKEIAQGVRDLLNSNVHCLTTFHLDRIWDLPHKLYEYYGEEYKDVLSQLNLVVNQKMFVKQCPYCLEKTSVDSLPNIYTKFLLKYGITSVYVNKGCEHCNNGELIGGVVILAESLLFTDKIITDLRGLNAPRDMEQYLKNLFLTNETFLQDSRSLEMKLVNGIKNKSLTYKSLLDLKTLGCD